MIYMLLMRHWRAEPYKQMINFDILQNLVSTQSEHAAKWIAKQLKSMTN